MVWGDLLTMCLQLTTSNDETKFVNGSLSGV